MVPSVVQYPSNERIVSSVTSVTCAHTTSISAGEGDGLADSDELPDALGDSDADPDADGDSDADVLAEAETDSLALVDAEGDTEALALILSLADGDAEALALSDAEAEVPAAILNVAIAEAQSLPPVPVCSTYRGVVADTSSTTAQIVLDFAPPPLNVAS